MKRYRKSFLRNTWKGRLAVGFCLVVWSLQEWQIVFNDSFVTAMVFPPKSSILCGVFHYKPSILVAHPYFLETPIYDFIWFHMISSYRPLISDDSQDFPITTSRLKLRAPGRWPLQVEVHLPGCAIFKVLWYMLVSGKVIFDMFNVLYFSGKVTEDDFFFNTEEVMV